MIVSFNPSIKNYISQKYLAILSFFYQLIFKEPMNEEAKNFTKNISYVGLGTILSTIFSFIFNILAGRILGPSGYGSFTLIQSIGMILYIPMLLGFSTAMIKYCAECKDPVYLNRMISTTYLAVFILIAISVVIYGVFINQLVTFFSTSQEIFILAIIFSVVYVFYTLQISTLRGLHLMKGYALFQPIFGIILLTTFLILIVIQPPSFLAMVLANYLAYGIVGGIVVIVFLKKYLMINFDRQWLAKAWRYSNLALIGGLSFTLYSNVDRILINHFIGVESVGIYGVYYYSSFAVIALFSGIFTTVFFPTASRISEKNLIYRKLNQLAPYLLIFGIPGTLLSEFVILQFFGKEYPINPWLMILFAVAAVLVTWYTILAWFFNAEGVNGARITVTGTMIIAVTNIVINLLLIPRIGLYGAIGATIISFTFGLCYNYYCGVKYFRGKLAS